MKKHLAVILIILSLGVLAWAQASKEPFDSKKSQTEIEIMKGILSTTIAHSAKDIETNAARFDSSDINAYYLVGQGIVFIIPTSQLGRWSAGDFAYGNWPDIPVDVDVNLEGLDELIEESQEFAREALRIQAESETVAAEIKNMAEQGGVAAPPAPPAPPALPALPRINREDFKKKTEAYREKLKKSREAAAANREKFLQSLKELQTPLIEALANYGDSMTTVKANEYVNLILLTDSYGRNSARHDIISAQKSWISDYKAGKLSLESFKQKVLQYTN